MIGAYLAQLETRSNLCNFLKKVNQFYLVFIMLLLNTGYMFLLSQKTTYTRVIFLTALNTSIPKKMNYQSVLINNFASE